MILSTFHSESKNEVTEVPSRYPNKSPIMKPNAVLDYTEHMGGINHSVHYTASYQFMSTKKWYRKMFFWLLEVSIVNSYLLMTWFRNNTVRGPQPIRSSNKVL
jgi:hypothetical protein